MLPRPRWKPISPSIRNGESVISRNIEPTIDTPATEIVTLPAISYLPAGTEMSPGVPSGSRPLTVSAMSVELTSSTNVPLMKLPRLPDRPRSP